MKMIDILTKGIGKELYNPIRIAYYNKLRFIERDVKYISCPKDIQNFIIDMTALSIFYQKVIVPLSGASNFKQGTKRYGVTNVRMGEYTLDRSFFLETHKISRHFFEIIKIYNIPIYNLNISSVNQFVEIWLRHIKNEEKENPLER